MFESQKNTRKNTNNFTNNVATITKSMSNING